MMNRRRLIEAVAAAAALPFLNRVASAQTSPKTKNVVFVHGLFADGSCWSKVIGRLQKKEASCPNHQRIFLERYARARRTRSAAICEDDPIPADAKVRAPGLAFAAATRSATVLNPLSREAINRFGDVPISTTGMKSLRGSYPSLLCSAASVAMEDELVTSV
jgi:hypothetical protein